MPCLIVQSHLVIPPSIGANGWSSCKDTVIKYNNYVDTFFAPKREIVLFDLTVLTFQETINIVRGVLMNFGEM